MLAIVHSCALVGLDGHLVEVQVDCSSKPGVPSFTIVGSPDSSVRESEKRVRSALINSHQHFPARMYTVNLSPASLPKHGSSYDLAIALGVLVATGQLDAEYLPGALYIGELTLDGRLNHVQGVLAMAHTALENGFRTVYVAAADAEEAAYVPGLTVIPVDSLGQLLEHLPGMNRIPPVKPRAVDLASIPLPHGVVDFADIKGQEHVKRALEIAAAGNHNVRMFGPPGVGKSLLSQAMVGILPPLTYDEALEVTRIYSVADKLPKGQPLILTRPFQAPHHSMSAAALLGGGTHPKPGQISLAHRGVLFLDEVTQMPTAMLESLRQPLEERKLTVGRARLSVTFPANFLLVVAHNPCPCGHLGDPLHPCTCSQAAIHKYHNRLSGPLLDRIDIHMEVPRVDHEKMLSARQGEPSASARQRVIQARMIQRQRFDGQAGVLTNADMNASHLSDLSRFFPMNADARKFLELSLKKSNVSGRGHHRVLKLSRTIADLDGSELIDVRHLAEAFQYRPKPLAI